ncbi:YqjD family protein [Polaromonas sp. UC242_47]|uniref:YqjD family protein n=1 Tax=Polaromonas sp. UC242_47 TaxID=3374626 RepID=UPI0037BA4A8E
MKTPNPDLPSTQQTLSTTRQLSDQVLNGVEHAVDQAESKFGQLRGSVDPMVDKLASQAQKLARQSLDMAAEARERAQQSVHRYADATTRYVANEPVKSVLIAATVGAALAWLVSAVRHRDSR